MSILKVARMGHPVLRQKAEPIDPSQITGPEIQLLIRNMFETLVEYRGVGLAAPQVHVPLRLVLAGGEEDAEGVPIIRVLINPEITVHDSDNQLGMYEGCLSVPGLRGYVERPALINLKAYDQKGEKIDLDLEGFAAIVTQHEVDHLDGVLYVDRIEDKHKFAFEDEAEKYLSMLEEDGGEESEEASSEGAS